jgi:hypothetical protein
MFSKVYLKLYYNCIQKVHCNTCISLEQFSGMWVYSSRQEAGY